MMNEEASESQRLGNDGADAAPVFVPIWPKAMMGYHGGMPSYAATLEHHQHPDSGICTDGVLGPLLRQACEEWIGVLGAYSLWIAVRTGPDAIAVASSFNERFAPLRRALCEGYQPACLRLAMASREPVVVNDPRQACGDCPLVPSYHGRSAVAMHLTDGEEVVGALCASVPDLMEGDEGLLDRLREAGRQISRELALHRERKALVHAEQVVHRIFQVAPVGIGLVVRGKIVEINDAWCRLCGSSRDALLGTPFAVLFPDAAAYESVARWMDSGATSREPAVFELALSSGDGFREVRVDLMALEPEATERGVIVSILDVTGQKAAERHVQEARRLLASLMDSLPGMAYRCRFDTSWTMEFISRGGEELTGYRRESLLGNKEISYNEVIHPEDRQRVYDSVDGMTRGDHFVIEYRIVRADGEVRWVWEQGRVVENDVSGVPMVEGFIIDITERRRLGENLVYLKKSESLAAMAGGVAHDFNNMLAAMIGNAEIALDHAGNPEEVRRCLSELLSAGERAAGLCRQLLSFCGNTRISDQLLDVSHLVRELVPLVRSTIHPDVKLHLALGDGALAVRGDGAELRQLILQVVVNAAESYLGQSGTVEVTSGCADLDGRELIDAVPMPAAPRGRYVWIEVRDGGCGITAEVRRRMFDPFFSTKFTGRGMGLAAVQGIVRAHQGVMEVHSAPGRGTSFRIYLPAAECAGTAPVNPVAAKSSTAIRRVLVVDDDPAMRLMLQRMLAVDRIEVELAADGAEALRRFRQDPAAYDLVLMDLTMPVMDGIDAFLQMRTLVPDVRVVLTTGYSEELILSRIDPRCFAGVLIKPFTRDRLVEVLSGAMTKEMAPPC